MAAGSLIGTTEEGKGGGARYRPKRSEVKVGRSRSSPAFLHDYGSTDVQACKFPSLPLLGLLPHQKTADQLWSLPPVPFDVFPLCERKLRSQATRQGYLGLLLSSTDSLNLTLVQSPLRSSHFPSPAEFIGPEGGSRKGGEGDRRAEKKEELATLLQGRRPY